MEDGEKKHVSKSCGICTILRLLKIKIESDVSRWTNKTSLPIFLLKNNHLPSIHGQKCLCGSFGIQIGDHESWCIPGLGKAILRRQILTQVTDPLTMVLSINPATTVCL